MFRRLFDATLVVLFLASLIVGAFFAGRSDPPPVAIAKVPTYNGFYLDIGGSASLGTQPTGVAVDNGHNTLNGYANDLIMIEHFHGVYLQLHHVGCAGETLQSMLATTGDHCYRPPTTQLSLAVRYLKKHRNEAGVVSVDIGLNNIRPCISRLFIGPDCAREQVALVDEDLPVIVRDLQRAAGPKVYIVGFEYDDPYLWDFLHGANGPALASATLTYTDEFNAALARVYARAKVKVANLPGVFENDDSERVTVDNVGTIPTNVAQICNLTWMCQPAPFGPDDHPNDEGYMAIAEAIAVNLPPATW